MIVHTDAVVSASGSKICHSSLRNSAYWLAEVDLPPLLSLRIFEFIMAPFTTEGDDLVDHPQRHGIIFTIIHRIAFRVMVPACPGFCYPLSP